MAAFIYITVIILSVVIITYLIWRTQIRNKPKAPALIEEINTFYTSADNIDDYITAAKSKELYENAKKLYKDLTILTFLNPTVKKFRNDYHHFSDFIEEENNKYINSQLSKNEALLGNIDGKSLDGHQRNAVITDENSNLVIAGSGSGKTLTIAAKVKYLCDVKKYSPEDILLLSFTTKASEEMSTRIKDKLGIPLSACTFHKLGLSIITQAEGSRHDVSDNLNEIVSKYFETEISKRNNVVTALIIFFSYYLNIPQDYDKFKSIGELYDFEKAADFETLKSKYSKQDYAQMKSKELKKRKHTLGSESVKSFEELMIANYLFLHGVKYEYERLYPYSSDDKTKKAYRPDFYLPDYDIYLEHFGITEDNKLPWLSPVEEKKYIEDMEWKRKFHKANNTTLLETYSYYRCLLEKLEELLLSNGVKFSDVDYLSIYNKVYQSISDKYFKEFIKLMCSFITLFKSNGYSIDDLENLLHRANINQNVFIQQRNGLFINIAKPIIEYYNDQLKEMGAIDFSDMINIATSHVLKGKVQLTYKYIIIDEYQDISVARYNLVKAIISRTGAKLLCVGDDWQSIYRFSGSDISLFTNFNKYFPDSAIRYIEKTYRNSQELINVAGSFIMKNQNQVSKKLISDFHIDKPIIILRYHRDPVRALIHAIDDIVLSYDENSDLFIIGRTHYDIDIIKGYNEFTFSDNSGKIKYSRNPKLKITFLTAHKSKGLEADNVIILNVENSLMGFPNKIADDPILDILLSTEDNYLYSEERRLFYVSITRTRNRTYLLVPDDNPSVFIPELEKSTYVQTISEGEKSIRENPLCPRCKTGHLVARRNANNTSVFLGCTHYPKCDYTINDTSILSETKVCPMCGGYLLPKKGRYGKFFGCSNYPHCSFTSKN